MIDRTARDKLSDAVQALATDQISDLEFKNRIPLGSTDPAVVNLYFYGAWGVYADLWKYRVMRKQSLTPESKAILERCALFLQTDLPFEWPRATGMQRMAALFKMLCTLGLGVSWFSRMYQPTGDWSVWPFFRRKDFEEARHSAIE